MYIHTFHRYIMHFIRKKRVLSNTGLIIIPGCVEVLCGLAVGPPHRPARVRATLPAHQGFSQLSDPDQGYVKHCRNF